MNQLKYRHFLTHSPVYYHFTKSSKDFTVEEIPLYEFSGSGEHLVLVIRKKGLTTWEMLQAFSERTGCKVRDIGYAGLKDKEGMTIQSISMEKKFAPKLENFEHDQIKILSQTLHNNKIKTGHLKGNRFFIRLKKVSPADAAKLHEALKMVATFGIPNYFGYQRFGNDGLNGQKGREILDGTRRERNPKVRKLMINAYQSELFNGWLSKRIELSHLLKDFTPKELASVTPLSEGVLKEMKKQPHFLKILSGEVCHHYPHGKPFVIDDVEAEATRFAERLAVPTGLLFGKKTIRAEGDAALYEKDFDAGEITEEFGDRRFAWIFPEDISGRYREEDAWFELEFFLPRGCYATNLLEEVTNTQIRESF
jgi:tRNA pseudouridine13 synthase